jgi:hypothetical protein
VDEEKYVLEKIKIILDWAIYIAVGILKKV